MIELFLLHNPKHTVLSILLLPSTLNLLSIPNDLQRNGTIRTIIGENEDRKRDDGAGEWI